VEAHCASTEKLNLALFKWLRPWFSFQAASAWNHQGLALLALQAAGPIVPAGKGGDGHGFFLLSTGLAVADRVRRGLRYLPSRRCV